jgi:hypothetical protein
VEASVPQVQFDSANKWLTRAVAEKDGRVRIELSLNITALPLGMAAKPEGFSVQLHAPDGTTWSANQVPLRYESDLDQKFSLQFTLDDAFYGTIKNKPLTIHGSLYLTLFGGRQSARIPFGDRLVTVPRVGICSASGGSSQRSDFLICTSAFRFSPVLVSYRFIQSANGAAPDVSTSTRPRSISYSPFPAEAGINPVSQDFTFSSSPAPFSQALVDTIEPLAYIQRNFTIDNLRLADYEVGPPRQLP